jgi:hypothetical protein
MSVLKKGEFVTNDGLEEFINGKVIKDVLRYTQYMDDYLTLVFTDGTSLLIRYDWLYDWTLVDHKIELSE